MCLNQLQHHKWHLWCASLWMKVVANLFTRLNFLTCILTWALTGKNVPSKNILSEILEKKTLKDGLILLWHHNWLLALKQHFLKNLRTNLEMFINPKQNLLWPQRSLTLGRIQIALHESIFFILRKHAWTFQKQKLPIINHQDCTGSHGTITFWESWQLKRMWDFPGGSVVKNQPADERRRFNSWVGKILWRSEWQPTQVFLPGKSYGQRSLVGKELDMT